MDQKTTDEIVKELLFLGLTKDDMKEVYKTFCDEYDMQKILKGTEIRKRYERKR